MSKQRKCDVSLGRRDYRTGMYERQPEETVGELYLRLVEANKISAALLHVDDYWPIYRDAADASIVYLAPKVLARLKQLEEVTRRVTRKNPVVARRRLYATLRKKCGLSDANIDRLYSEISARDHNDIRKLALGLGLRGADFGQADSEGNQKFIRIG